MPTSNLLGYYVRSHNLDRIELTVTVGEGEVQQEHQMIQPERSYRAKR